jgi:hypothetical protein
VVIEVLLVIEVTQVKHFKLVKLIPVVILVKFLMVFLVVKLVIEVIVTLVVTLTLEVKYFK